MLNLVERAKELIIEAIKEDELSLPVLPEIALRVRDIAEDPDASIPELVREISLDAALSAHLIKVVNSPLLRTRQEVTDLSAAVTRLGVVFTSNLAVGMSMAQLFQATSVSVDKRMRECWLSSTEVAAISHELCRQHTRLQPGQATLAGLVHLVGVLPILLYAEEHEALLRKPDVLDKVIEQIHPVIGDHILEEWGFPKQLLGVPGQYSDLQRTPSAVDYADIVQLASLQRAYNTGQLSADFDWNDIPAYRRLGLSADDEPLGGAFSASIASALGESTE